jgi:zinc transporter, ZIP family
MSPMLTLVLAGIGTALATGLGAIPVSVLGPARAESLRPVLLGLAAGVMAVASVVGLLLPGIDEGSVGSVAVGLAVGVAFLLATRRWLHHHEPHVGRLRGASVSTSVLVFAVLFAHSLPEGFAIGTAYASDTEGLSLFVIVAIALQNIPEGTSVAVPMQRAGFTPAQQFWAAVATSAPQPIGAVIAYLAVEQVESLLPVSFGFAAGAMLALVVVELMPDAVRAGGWQPTLTGFASGAAVMLGLSLALGVG